MPRRSREKEYEGEVPCHNRKPPPPLHRSKHTYAEQYYGPPGCACRYSDRSNPTLSAHAVAKPTGSPQRYPPDIAPEADRSGIPRQLDTLAVPYSRSPCRCAVALRSGPDGTRESAGYKTPRETSWRQSIGCPDRTACDTHSPKHHHLPRGPFPPRRARPPDNRS